MCSCCYHWPHFGRALGWEVVLRLLQGWEELLRSLQGCVMGVGIGTLLQAALRHQQGLDLDSSQSLHRRKDGHGLQPNKVPGS
jgi:hypothetical protein